MRQIVLQGGRQAMVTLQARQLPATGSILRMLLRNEHCPQLIPCRKQNTVVYTAVSVLAQAMDEVLHRAAHTWLHGPSELLHRYSRRNGGQIASLDVLWQYNSRTIDTSAPVPSVI